MPTLTTDRLALSYLVTCPMSEPDGWPPAQFHETNETMDKGIKRMENRDIPLPRIRRDT
jgi:hypothetical protein